MRAAIIRYFVSARNLEIMQPGRRGVSRRCGRSRSHCCSIAARRLHRGAGSRSRRSCGTHAGRAYRFSGHLYLLADVGSQCIEVPRQRVGLAAGVGQIICSAGGRATQAPCQCVCASAILGGAGSSIARRIRALARRRGLSLSRRSLLPSGRALARIGLAGVHCAGICLPRIRLTSVHLIVSILTGSSLTWTRRWGRLRAIGGRRGLGANPNRAQQQNP
jgi:hypothetical protein